MLPFVGRRRELLRLTELHTAGRLTRSDAAIGSAEAAALLPAVNAVEGRLRAMAEALGLLASVEPVRRTLVVAIEFASFHLYECRPAHGFSGFGEIAPATADYLELEIPQLDTVLRPLIELLQPSPRP